MPGYFKEALVLLKSSPKIIVLGLVLTLLMIPPFELPDFGFNWLLGITSLIFFYLFFVYSYSAPLFYQEIQKKNQLKKEFLLEVMRINSKDFFFPF